MVLDATRAERAWNYVGAWIHWLYPFRGNALDRWWHDIVVWLSVAGVTLALTGTVVGLMRWRFSRPYASGSRSPYRENMMRWHHLSGLLFAVVTITWIFSGLMSMNPWKLFASSAARWRRRPWPRRARWPCPPRPGTELDARLVQARMAAGAPLRAQARPSPTPRAAECRRWSATTSTTTRDEHAMLGRKPLPAWRLVYDNPEATWIYLDPATGQLIGRQDRAHRASLAVRLPAQLGLDRPAGAPPGTRC